MSIFIILLKRIKSNRLDRSGLNLLTVAAADYYVAADATTNSAAGDGTAVAATASDCDAAADYDAAADAAADTDTDVAVVASN